MKCTGERMETSPVMTSPYTCNLNTNCLTTQLGHWPWQASVSVPFIPCQFSDLNDGCIQMNMLQFEPMKTSRTIEQYHFTTWPDHGVPSHGAALLRFRRRALHSREDYPPLVVHCRCNKEESKTSYIFIFLCSFLHSLFITISQPLSLSLSLSLTN